MSVRKYVALCMGFFALAVASLMLEGWVQAQSSLWPGSKVQVTPPDHYTNVTLQALLDNEEIGNYFNNIVLGTELNGMFFFFDALGPAAAFDDVVTAIECYRASVGEIEYPICRFQFNANEDFAGISLNQRMHRWVYQHEMAFKPAGSSVRAELNATLTPPVYSSDLTSVVGTFTPGEIVTLGATGAEARILGICDGDTSAKANQCVDVAYDQAGLNRCSGTCKALGDGTPITADQVLLIHQTANDDTDHLLDQGGVTITGADSGATATLATPVIKTAFNHRFLAHEFLADSMTGIMAWYMNPYHKAPTLLMDANGVDIRGAWETPFCFAEQTGIEDLCLWNDVNDALFMKRGEPSSDTDGTPLAIGVCNITIETATTADDIMCGKADGTLQVLDLNCVGTGATTPTDQVVTVVEYDAAGDNSTTTGLTIEADALVTNYADTTPTNAQIDDGDWWGIETTSVGTAADYLHCQVTHARAP